jgi:hypothetical protein
MTTEFHKSQRSIAEAMDACDALLLARSQPRDLTEDADLIRLAIKSLSDALPYYRGLVRDEAEAPNSRGLSSARAKNSAKPASFSRTGALERTRTSTAFTTGT